MYVTKEEIEEVVPRLVGNKAISFIKEYHLQRMEQLKKQSPQYYEKMTAEELSKEYEKEKEIVEEYFMEAGDYLKTIPATNMLATGDDIPQSTIEIIERYFTELFYQPHDELETPKKFNYTAIANVIYEMTARLVEHILRAWDAKKFHIDGKYFSDNKKRMKPTTREMVKTLTRIINEYTSDCPEMDRLVESLEDFHNNIDKYIFPEYALLTASLIKDYLQPLREYLNELLPKKQTAIDNFTSELIGDIQKAYSIKTQRYKKVIST